MAIKHKIWTQDRWERAGKSVFSKNGDFYSASGLFPTRDRSQLRRGPSWSSFDTDVLGTDVINVRALFYNPRFHHWIFVGTDSGGGIEIATSADLDAQDRHFNVDTAAGGGFLACGGRPGQNFAVSRDYLYIIGDDQTVYAMKNDPLDDWDLTEVGTMTDAALIAIVAGQLYGITEDADLHIADSPTGDFSALHTPVIHRHPIAAIGYESKIHVFAASDRNAIDVWEVTLPDGTQAKPTLSFPAGTVQPFDVLACQHAGLIWFAAGRQILDDRSDPSTSWANPSATHDPDGEYTDDSNAINGSTANYAYDTKGTAAGWFAFLYFDVFAPTDKIRIYLDTNHINVTRAQIDILVGGIWQTVYLNDAVDGFTTGSYLTIDFGRVTFLDRIRIRGYNSSSSSYQFRIHSVQYNDAGHADATYAFDIYTYDATYSPNYKTHVEITGESYNAGFLPWNGELLFYLLGSGSSTADHQFKLLLDEGAVDLETLTGNVQSDFQAIAASARNTLVVTGDNGTNNGHYHANLDSLSDGHVITSRLDFDNPHQIKHLNSITVLMDGGETDFDVKIHYRLDDASSWTLAATDDDTKRISATDIDETFYVLQLKIEIDDNSGNESDYRIDKIDVQYATGF